MQKRLSVSGKSQDQLVTILQDGLEDLFDRWGLEEVQLNFDPNTKTFTIESSQILGYFTCKDAQISFVGHLRVRYFFKKSFFLNGFDEWTSCLFSAIRSL